MQIVQASNYISDLSVNAVRTKNERRVVKNLPLPGKRYRGAFHQQFQQALKNHREGVSYILNKQELDQNCSLPTLKYTVERCLQAALVGGDISVV